MKQIVRVLAAAVLMNLTACGPSAKYGAALTGGDDGASNESPGSGGGAASATSSGGNDAGSIDESLGSCAIDRAFGAQSMTFETPTPKDLGLALSALTYDAQSKAMTVVLAAAPARPIARVTASITEANGSSPDGFPKSSKPTFAEVTPDDGGFCTGKPIDVTFLRLRDPKGDVDLEVDDAILYAKRDQGCGALWVVIEGKIPAKEGSTKLTTANGEASIADLANEPPAGGGYPIRASFLATPVGFDFASLP